MLFRKAVGRDLPAIAEIYVDTHTEIEAGRLSVGWIRSIYPTAKTAEAALARDDLYVAEMDGEIVGTAIINQRQEEMYAGAPWAYAAPDDQILVLHTLVISPKHAGKGYASQFVRFYEDCARKTGCTCLRMDTNAINLRAQALYQRLGYRTAGVVPCDFNGLPNIRLVLLEKEISSPVENDRDIL